MDTCIAQKMLVDTDASWILPPDKKLGNADINLHFKTWNLQLFWVAKHYSLLSIKARATSQKKNCSYDKRNSSWLVGELESCSAHNRCLRRRKHCGYKKQTAAKLLFFFFLKICQKQLSNIELHFFFCSKRVKGNTEQEKDLRRFTNGV